MPPPAEGQAAMAAALLDPARPGPPDPRFAVHRNNVVAGLISALGEAYPAVSSLVGEAFFSAAAREFLRAHPPRSPVLLLWGDAFPDWLAAFPPAARLPYLPDVARLERARRRAYHAADATPLGPGSLAEIAPDRLPDLRLRLHPSAGLVVSAHPVLSIWQDVMGARRGGIDMTRPETAVVVRPLDAVLAEAAPPALAVFLAGLEAGETLSAATEAAAARDADFDLGDAVAALFRLGLIAEIVPHQEASR